MKVFWATAFNAKNWRMAVAEIERAYKGKEIIVYPITRLRARLPVQRRHAALGARGCAAGRQDSHPGGSRVVGIALGSARATPD